MDDTGVGCRLRFPGSWVSGLRSQVLVLGETSFQKVGVGGGTPVCVCCDPQDAIRSLVARSDINDKQLARVFGVKKNDKKSEKRVYPRGRGGGILSGRFRIVRGEREKKKKKKRSQGRRESNRW